MPARRAGDPAGLPPIGGGFVGRQRELDRVGALLMGPARLVTLIGPGGIGKTRLAEETTRRLHTARHTPVWCVRLARLSRGVDAAAVKEAVAAAVLAEGFVAAPAWDGVVQRLSPLDGAGRVVPTILLLDNCEHVLAGAQAAIADLLDAVPRLTILATSREPLGWIDEQLVVVPPLSAPHSVELFGQRAELTGHPITEPSQVALAQQVCGHMHGHPLCIRLAAARMFYEPLPMILEQLSGESDDMRMRWRHSLEGRHRTIGDVIAWSYELCADKQRLLFDRMSVFAPGYDTNQGDDSTGPVDVGAELEAIEVVCADDVSIEGCQGSPSTVSVDQACPAVRLASSEIRGLLERLVEQSLVSIHLTSDTVRYYLLESLRLFAEDRLAERCTEQIDEPARLAARHCYYYRDKIVQAQTKLFGPADQELLSWTIQEWPNIVRAIDTGMHASGEAVVALQIAMSVRAIFFVGSVPEIRGRVERILAAMQASGPELTEFQLVAMAQVALLALSEGCPGDAEELLERCVAAYDTDAAHTGRWRDRPDSDIGLPAAVELAWGVELMFVRRDPRAIALLARACKKFRDTGDQVSVAACGAYEAVAAGFFGPAAQAMTIAQRHLEWTTAAGASWAMAWAQMGLAVVLTKHGDAEEALQVGRAALASQLSIGDHWGSTWVVHVRMWSLARLITDQVAAGNASRTAVVKLATEIAYIAGGLKTLRAWLSVPIENLGPFADETSTAEKIARNVLGQQTYADIQNRGSRLSPERLEVQRIALGTLSINKLSRNVLAAASTSGWHALSGAEQEVAILAAAGWSNSAIGVRRGTSAKTIEAQMSSIFQKLMIDSRQDIVHFVPRDQRGRLVEERLRRPRRSQGKPRSIHSRPQD